MSLPVYPVLPGLGFTVLKTPEFDTLAMKAANSYEVRLAQTVNPVWQFTLIYDFLRDFPLLATPPALPTVSELRTLMGFYLAQSGMAGSFLFSDPDDNAVGPALSSTTGGPNTPMAQLPLVNDGAGNYYSPLQRTLDGGFYEDVTDPYNLEVYANGVLASSGVYPGQYLLQGPGLALPNASYMGMYLKWGAGAPPATPITAQFSFYYRVCFASDSVDFEKFLSLGAQAAQSGQGGGWWTIGGVEGRRGRGMLKLRTARPAPL